MKPSERERLELIKIRDKYLPAYSAIDSQSNKKVSIQRALQHGSFPTWAYVRNGNPPLKY